MIVWNGTDLVMGAVAAFALVLIGVAFLIGKYCEWLEKRQEKREEEDE